MSGTRAGAAGMSTIVDQGGYHLIPEACRRALIRHIHFGHEAGGFIEAVLRNDLMKAAARADHINAPILHVYATFLCNCAPAPSFGSPQKVTAWRERTAEDRFPAHGWDWPASWRAEIDQVEHEENERRSR